MIARQLPALFVPLVSLALAISQAASSGAADDATPEPIAGIGPIGPIKEISQDFQFTEGPAADAAGNIYFSDIPTAVVYQVDPQGKLSVFRRESGHSNGLMFNARGELVATEMDGRVTATDVATGKTRVLVGEYNGSRFNAPNDLVIDSAGGIYFTDPHFRAPMPLPQDKLGVYYLSPAGKIARLIDDLKAPNGVILAPDEKTLYVIPSLQAEMMAYPVLAPGKLGEGKVFCTLRQPEGKKDTGGDGLTIDSQGNLYIASGLGLQVYDPQGKLLGIIPFPQQPANVTFGGPDGKTLYVTARKGLYTAPMQVKGHRFATGKQ